MSGKRVKKGRRRGERERQTKDRGTGEEEGRKGERGGEHREEEKERYGREGKSWSREKNTNKFIFWCLLLGIPDQGVIHDLFYPDFL